MAKILNLDEMQEILKELGDPTADLFAQHLMDLGDAMAERIITVLQARDVDIDCRPTACDGTAFGGTCAAFSPTKLGQPVPEALAAYDEDGEWEPRMCIGFPSEDAARETLAPTPGR